MASKLRDNLIFGMGNPLLDITANTDDEFLQKYGMKPNDAILAEEKHKPMYDEMVSKYNVEYTAGGAVQNTMRAVQWILNKPNTCVFMGSVGNDNYGKVLGEKAMEAGVNVRYQIHQSEPTGTCAVVLTKQGTNRSLCANLGAANHFTKDHLEKPDNYKFIESAEIFYVSEADTFAKEQNLGVTCRKEIALKICKMPKINDKRSRITIITQGKDPVIVAKDNEITEYEAVQLDSNLVLDTNGAGDAFVGGFLAQLSQNQPVEICVKCGIFAATEVIQRSGVTFPSSYSFKV